MGSARASSARLDFLNEASRELFALSPTVAAHLQMTRGEAAISRANHANQSKASELICTACGNLMLPGWSCTSTREKRAPGKGKHFKGPGKLTNKKKLECNMCATAVSVEIEKSSRMPARSSSTGRKLSRPSSLVLASAPSSSATERAEGLESETTSQPQPKKRARGKKASLQAMLAAQKKPTSTTTNSGFGLDLMDFTKT